MFKPNVERSKHGAFSKDPFILLLYIHSLTTRNSYGLSLGLKRIYLSFKDNFK